MNNIDDTLSLHRFGRYYTSLGPWFKKPEVRAYTFLILSFFACAFFLFFAIRPTLNTIINLRKQIADSETVNKKLTVKINALSQIQAEYEIIKPNLLVVSQSLPAVADIAGLVQQVEKITKDNQASLSAVQFGEVDLSGGNSKTSGQEGVPVTFQITTGGDYNQLLSLIKKITRLPRIITTETVSINSKIPSLVATIRLKAFYFKQ